MTWQKLGQEFWDECAEADLSNGAVRTHAEAIGWLYRVESWDLHIPRHLVRRFAGSDTWEVDVKELVSVGFWLQGDGFYVVKHHAPVIRQSIAAQVHKRKTERDRQRAKRAKKAPDVGGDVGTNTDTHVGATQSVSQTDAVKGSESKRFACWLCRDEGCDLCGSGEST